MQSKQDRQIQVSGWTEQRAIAARLRLFWSQLEESNVVQRTIEISSISDASIHRASLLLDNWYDNEGTVLNRPRFIKDYLHTYVFDERRGEEKPAKYIAKQLKARYNTKLPSDIKSKLGQILTSGVSRTITVKFTLGCEGTKSNYYHTHSCYWGEYAGSRDYIEYAGGGAIRLYDETDQIIGRAWFIPHSSDDLENGLIMFNAYGENELAQMYTWGDIVAQVLKSDQQNLDVCLEEQGSAGFHLNSANTIFIGAVHTPSSHKPYVKKYLEEPDTYTYWSEQEWCEWCEEYHTETTYVDAVDESICDACLENSFIYLENGEYEGYHTLGNVVEVTCYSASGGTILRDYHCEDKEIYQIEDEYYHQDLIVIDEYGDLHIRDNDTWVQCEDSTIYPIDECTENEDGEWHHD